MKSLHLTLILTLTLISGNSGIKTINLYGKIGSAISLPGVVTDNDTFHDFKFGNSLVMNHHFGSKIFDSYIHRSRYNPSDGSFLLTGLTKKDSGTYRHWLNFTLVMQITLQVIESVGTPEIMIHVKEDNAQCLISMECHIPPGEGPFNITITRNQEDVTRNMSGNSAALDLDGWDPMHAGRYRCNVENPVSFQFTTTEILPAATRDQTIMAYISVALLFYWALYMLYTICAIIWDCIKEEEPEEQQCRAEGKEEMELSIHIQAFKCFITSSAILLGFSSEVAAVYISWYGGFFPHSWCIFPALCLALRTVVCTLSVIRVQRKAGRCSCLPEDPELSAESGTARRCFGRGEKICFRLNFYSTPVMKVSSLIGVPVFFGFVVYIYSTFYSPCGKLGIVYVMLACLEVLLILLVLLFTCYMWISKSKIYTFFNTHICSMCCKKKEDPDKKLDTDSNVSLLQDSRGNSGAEPVEHRRSNKSSDLQDPDEAVTSQSPDAPALAQNYDNLATAEDGGAHPNQYEAHC